MKKTIKLFYIIAIVAVIGLLASACKGKKDGGGNSDSGSSSGGASSSNSSEEELSVEEWLRTFPENPASDFNYELTKDGRGVKISYATAFSNGGILIIPSKIEGYPVLEIGDEAFSEQRGIQYIVVPDSVEIIGTRAFYKMRDLIMARLPDGLKVIASELFEECGSLWRVNLPARLEEIYDSAFFLCVGLSELIIPNSIQTVRFMHSDNYGYVKAKEQPGNGAFTGCQKLPLATRAKIESWGYTATNYGNSAF